MPHDVIMPALGMAQDTGKIVAWLKAPGDKVAEGDPLFEVETDKATMEVEAAHAGYLANVSAAAGEDVPVGQVVAAIAESADGASAVTGPAAPPARESEAAPAAAAPVEGRKVIMPALGMAQDTGKIISWLKVPGDRVAAGDPLLEVETDKSTMEVEADTAGWLAAVHAEAGADVPVGEVIAVICEHQPAAPDVTAAPAAPRPAAIPAPAAAPASRAAAGPAPGRSPAPDERVLASPKARRIARERGIDIAALFARSGGRPIHVADLDRLAAPAAAQPLAPSPERSPSGEPLRIEAEVARGPLAGFLDWIDADTGTTTAPGIVLAAFAAGALREANGADHVAVHLETPGNSPGAHYADPDRRIAEPVANDEAGPPALVVRDLTRSRITTLRLGPAVAPVLTIAARGDALAVILEFDAQQFGEETALALVEGFADRLEEPLRQLF